MKTAIKILLPAVPFLTGTAMNPSAQPGGRALQKNAGGPAAVKKYLFLDDR